jgi:hypothetical protein
MTVSKRHAMRRDHIFPRRRKVKVVPVSKGGGFTRLLQWPVCDSVLQNTNLTFIVYNIKGLKVAYLLTPSVSEAT